MEQHDCICDELKLGINQIKKVCAPIYEPKGDDFILSSRFTLAKQYCIVDLETNTIEVFDSHKIEELMAMDKGSGFKTMGIDAVLSTGVAPMALKILHDNNIRVYRPASASLKANCQLLKQQLLMEVASADKSDGSCSSDACSSCSSTQCSSN